MYTHTNTHKHTHTHTHTHTYPLMKQKLFRTKFMKSFTALGRNIWYGWSN